MDNLDEKDKGIIQMMAALYYDGWEDCLTALSEALTENTDPEDAITALEITATLDRIRYQTRRHYYQVLAKI